MTEYEVFNRLHFRRSNESRLEEARSLLGRVALSELSQPIWARALEPFPLPVRTLDALHLASFQFLLAVDSKLSLATYDQRLLETAQKMKLKLYRL